MSAAVSTVSVVVALRARDDVFVAMRPRDDIVPPNVRLPMADGVRVPVAVRDAMAPRVCAPERFCKSERVVTRFESDCVGRDTTLFVVVRADKRLSLLELLERVFVAVLRSRTMEPVFCVFTVRDAVALGADDVPDGCVVVGFCRFDETVAVVPRRVAARDVSIASSARPARSISGASNAIKSSFVPFILDYLDVSKFMKCGASIKIRYCYVFKRIFCL